MDTGEIAVIGIFSSMLVLSVAVSFFIVIRAFRGGGGKRSSKVDSDETRLIQDLHHGLSRMEDRIETLETLLIDRDRQHRAEFGRDLNTP